MQAKGRQQEPYCSRCCPLYCLRGLRWCRRCFCVRYELFRFVFFVRNSADSASLHSEIPVPQQSAWCRQTLTLKRNHLLEYCCFLLLVAKAVYVCTGSIYMQYHAQKNGIVNSIENVENYPGSAARTETVRSGDGGGGGGVHGRTMTAGTLLLLNRTLLLPAQQLTKAAEG